ncbi:uncharacterized protein [Littorina saxatilis]|uniref:BPTI/Kunitz inhibitor domain-containing protein n=1 Tax=Littorina saxatilis TaxID=31220 RepID=A0AAN9BF35_9CAEN
MDFYALLSVFPLLLLQSSGQLAPYQAVPENCGRICFPSDGYAVWFGGTLCKCRSELCNNKYCSRQKQCKVKNLWYGDVAVCEKAAETQTFPNPWTDSKPVSVSAAQSCSLPPVTGDCRALIPRFHFDSATNTCKSFVYGGCGGNSNNFLNLRECLQRCQPSISDGGFGSSGNVGNNGGNHGGNNNNNDNDTRLSGLLYKLFADRFGK